MLKLTNKTINYTVSYTDSTLAINGSVTFQDEVLTSFSGSVNENDTYIGGFSYSENTDEKANKNIYDVPTDKIDTVEDLIDIVVDEIKKQYK